MINAISNAIPSHPVAQTTAASQPAAKPAATTAPAAVPPAVTVNISSAAAAMAKELTETPAQTAKEANSGDIQAKKLLAREVAERMK